MGRINVKDPSQLAGAETLEKYGRKGFKAKMSGGQVVTEKTHYQGGVYEQAKLTKNEDENTGKLLEVPARALVGVGHALGGVMGFHSKPLSESFKKVKEVYNDPNKPVISGMKPVRAVVGVAGTVLTAGLLPALSKDFRDATINPVIYGKAEETVWFKSDEVENTEHIGYRPKQKNSVQEYARRLMAEKSPLVRQIGGHMVILENRRHGRSSFIFIPNGNPDEATSIKYWRTKDGSAITNPKDQWIAIQKYCHAIDQVKTDFDKDATDMAKKVIEFKNSQEPDPTLHISIEDQKKVDHYKEKLKKRANIVVLGSTEARFFSKVDPNKSNMASYMAGTRVAYSKDTQKAIEKAEGTSMEDKQNLRGDTPFSEKEPTDTDTMPASHFSKTDWEDEQDLLDPKGKVGTP